MKKALFLLLAFLSLAVTADVLHSYIKNNGMSELFLPRIILYKDELPVGGTGKMDNMTLKKMVLEELNDSAA